MKVFDISRNSSFSDEEKKFFFQFHWVFSVQTLFEVLWSCIQIIWSTDFRRWFYPMLGMSFSSVVANLKKNYNFFRELEPICFKIM